MPKLTMVEKTCAGPRLFVAGVEVRSWLGTAHDEEADALAREIDLAAGQPIPIRLNCPQCGDLHIDEGEFATKPHHTHACQGCGMTWRPALVCTVGVQFLPGFLNNPS